MNIKIPNKIKIATYEYTVFYVPNLEYDHKLLAQCLTDKQQIKIAPKNKKVQNVSFLHEICHAISDVYGCGLTEENTDRMAHGIAELLFNNLEIEFDWGDFDKLEGLNES